MQISIRQSFRGFLCVLCLAILTVSGWATLVPQQSLEEMASEAQFVIHGKVVRKWSAWDAGGQMIWTHYQIQLEETLKGNPGNSPVVSEPGGVVGDQGMSIAGTPEYTVGDEVVLLVWRTPIGYLRTSGWGQGKFTVAATAAGSVKIVHAPLQLRGIELVSPQKAGAPRQAGTLPSGLDGLPLEQFKGRLRTILRGAGGAR